jgi:hypothetical protein
VVKALRFIEQRINAMIQIWGVDDIAFKVEDIASKMHSHAGQARENEGLLQSPAAKDEGLKQDDVDRVLRDAFRGCRRPLKAWERAWQSPRPSSRSRAPRGRRASSGRSP